MRVARAHKPLTLKACGEILGISPRQWSRYEAGDYKEAAPLSSEELRLVAEATGVPVWFMLGGWAAEEREPALVERVEALEHKLSAYAETTKTDALGLVEQALADLGLAPPPGQGATPSDEDDQDHPGRAAAGDGA